MRVAAAVQGESQAACEHYYWHYYYYHQCYHFCYFHIIIASSVLRGDRGGQGRSGGSGDPAERAARGPPDGSAIDDSLERLLCVQAVAGVPS